MYETGFDLTADVERGIHSVCLLAQDFPQATYTQAGECKTMISRGAVSTKRVSGEDRYATAAEVSRAAYPQSAQTVVVATGEDFADSLAAGPAAAKLGGPLLLTQVDALPEVTRAEIARLQPSKIVVVGGEGAVSSEVMAQLRSLSSRVVRIAGADRFTTSGLLASYAFTSSPVAYVASGASFSDAIAAGSAAAKLGGPLLLVDPSGGGANAIVSARLQALRVSRVRVVGGEDAVPGSVFNYVTASVPHATRVQGENRYLTAVAVSKDAFDARSTSRAYVASGLDFPDGLVAPPLTAKTNSPLLLSDGNCLHREVVAELDRLGASELTLIGDDSRLGKGIAAAKICE